MNFGILKECSFFSVHIFPSVSSVKSVSGPMASTATFKFDLQISMPERKTFLRDVLPEASMISFFSEASLYSIGISVVHVSAFI